MPAGRASWSNCSNIRARTTGCRDPSTCSDFLQKKTLAARRESPAVVSFLYSSSPCSDANRRLRAPVVRPASVRGRCRGSDASAGDFCFRCGKSRAKSPSKQASTIEILPQIPRRPTLAAREASPAAMATPCTRNSGTEAGSGGGAGASQAGKASYSVAACLCFLSTCAWLCYAI